MICDQLKMISQKVVVEFAHAKDNCDPLSVNLDVPALGGRQAARFIIIITIITMFINRSTPCIQARDKVGKK